MQTIEGPQGNPIPDYPPLPKPKGRFNNWGERKWITAPPDKLEAVNKESSQLDLSPRARALYQAARLTDSEGVEFVFISNAQFPAPATFQGNAIHIVPCFIPLKLAPGAFSENRQAAMMKRGQFIYDGWVSSNEWTATQLEQVISSLDDLVNVFSIVGKYYAYWEPKYYFEKTPVPSHLIFPNEFAGLSQTVDILDSLSSKDRRAVSRSVAWMADALRDESPVQRFLLLFVSIEALATYIENELDQDSYLRPFAGDRLSKSERKQRRENCISQILASGLEPIAAIRKAYFECVVGSRKMLEEHLNRVLDGEQASNLLFHEEIDGKTLWALRNDIAHGSLNVLSESDIQILVNRVPVLEEIARSYLQRILSKLAKIDYFPIARPPILTFPASHGMGTTSTQYMGSTDMAEYYANVEALTTSFIRVTF